MFVPRRGSTYPLPLVACKIVFPGRRSSLGLGCILISGVSRSKGRGHFTRVASVLHPVGSFRKIHVSSNSLEYEQSLSIANTTAQNMFGPRSPD